MQLQTVKIIRQTERYIDIHLDSRQEHSTSTSPVSASSMKPTLLLGVDQACFSGSMIIRICTIDIDENPGDTTLVESSPEPQTVNTPKPHSKSITSSSGIIVATPQSPKESLCLEDLDFTLNTQDLDSQYGLSTQAANFLDMCDGRDDLVLERDAKAIETASGIAACEVSPRRILEASRTDHKAKSSISVDVSPIVRNGSATLAEISRLLPPSTPVRTWPRVIAHDQVSVKVNAVDDVNELLETQGATDGSSTDSEPNEEMEDIWSDVPASQSSEIPMVRLVPVVCLEIY
ncbi:hypothetical protein PM082_009375 [Marasmius tenuissimus]|nr:hypothetical protein PM082_009375 [Marasmius tenuissimus]